jgi:hypothetical protein
VKKAARAAAVREYVTRMRWVSHVMEKQDAADWQHYQQQLGAAAMLRVGDALRRSARRRCPDWPTADDEADDLAHHIRMSDALQRASRRRRR